MHGPYCKLWTTKFAERLTSGNRGILKGYGDGILNLVYIQDLIRAVFLSLKSETAVGDAININGCDTVPWNEYFRLLNSALGLPGLNKIGLGRSRTRAVLTTPLGLIARHALRHYSDAVTRLYRGFVGVQEFMKRTEGLLKTTPSMTELKKLSRKVHYSISRARSGLGHEPRCSIGVGLEMSARWLNHESLFCDDRISDISQEP